MSLLRVLFFSLVSVAIGCTNNSPLYLYETSGTAVDQAGGCPKPPDLAPPAAKCAAAVGLSGTNLMCVDFPKLSSLADLPDWNFNNPPNCWELDPASKKLQVKGFSTFASSCGFLMPAISPSDYQKYNRFTLSMVHRVDLNDQQQTAQVFFGLDVAKRLLDQTTGAQPRKQWVHTIAKDDLPPAAGGVFQPLFKLTSNVMVGSVNQGWQIESIAVMGLP